MLTRERIHETVEMYRQEAIDCLVELVQTPSTTGDEVAISKVFCKWLEKAGLEPKVVGCAPEHPNVIAEWSGTQPGKKFQFNGHMDAYPPCDGDFGLYGPYSGKVADGYIYGRGASDMKGGDAAALMAVTFLKRAGFDPKGSIEVSYMCDEENGSTYGVKWLLENGYLKGDFGICMEPTHGQLLIGQSGIYRITVTYTGTPASTYRPHPTMDSLEKAHLALSEIYKLSHEIESRKVPYYGSPSLEVSTFHSGKAFNTFSTVSTFSIDRRMVPGETMESCEAEIRAVLDKLKNQYPEMDYELKQFSDRPAMEISEDDSFIQTVRQAMEEVTGKPVELYRRHGGSDGANINAAYGTPFPNIGAADDLNEPAKADEKIPIEDYLRSIEYYMLSVVRMLG
ncbi:M20 family peptidase [Pseudoflavonifractor sp. 60]|uniref:M20 family metallopeptidase n=1 Tax=Pseudoflavonifractor sp. 60 TaxID=2304576 RepID=UPI001371C9DC|nr:M20/M25/M40 family metallo-hydrolase [Pseudoflavonifractor sp. 60]NBI67909.1 M20 family peptidase [Pseudoflavonifractor sp. 60]